MRKRLFGRERSYPFRLLGLLASVLLLAGCGGGGSSDEYAEPAAVENPAIQGASTNVLVGPATLKSWIDQGLAASQGASQAAAFNNQRLVIIDVDGGDEMIKGAQAVSLGSELTATRLEGVADAGVLVATGEMMDACIQKLGIDENTTIVFTSAAPYKATRAYWTFRYWGFPREKLKFLNGGNTAFAAAYPTLMTTEVAEVQPSTYSVKDLGGLKADLRASIGELLQAFDALQEEDPNVVVIDARGDAATSGYQGTKTTSGKFGGVVVVDGHPEGGQGLNGFELLDGDNNFKSATEIKALLEAKGWEPGKKVTVYCTSGYLASLPFFALDAILDAPVQLHDGSWSQTGKYSDWAAAGGELPSGSPWAIDSYLAVAKYNYENADPLTIETLQLDTAAEAVAPFTGDTAGDDTNSVANAIETADAAAVGAAQTVTIADPATTSTASVLIEPATLQSWTDAGLVNKTQGSERVVILDANSSTAYEAGHLPGAQWWDVSQHVETRTEGPAPAVNMTVTAARMNELIQAHGIDENTTIVFTTSGHPIYPARAYFLFRYYGWPKSRLKVLNGFNGAWESSDLTTEAPTVTASTLTVQQIANHQPGLRLSLPELMDALRDGRGKPVDVRGDSSAAGSTSGVFTDVSGDYVVFEGRPNNGAYFNWTGFMVDYSNGDQRFLSAADLRSALSTNGVSASDGPVYPYCRTGYLASLGFLVMDGILGWDTMLYDGSWSQLGKLSATAAKGGELPVGSLWAVDNATYMEVVNYNVDKTQDVEALNPDSATLATDPLTSPPNQVEEADTTYQSQGGSAQEEAQAPTPTDSPAIGC